MGTTIAKREEEKRKRRGEIDKEEEGFAGGEEGRGSWADGVGMES